MTTIKEIVQRAREKLAKNEGMIGNNCLIYFDSLPVRGDIYCGNVSSAQVGNARGPWKTRIYLRLQLDCNAPTLDESLDGLEKLVAEWAGGKTLGELGAQEIRVVTEEQALGLLKVMTSADAILAVWHNMNLQHVVDQQELTNLRERLNLAEKELHEAVQANYSLHEMLNK